MNSIEHWVLGQLEGSEDPMLRAVRRVRCRPLNEARPTSHHFRVELVPGGRRDLLFLKLYGEARQDVDVEREAAALSWVGRHGFDGANWAVPRVIGADAARRALLLTYCAGRSMTRRLHRLLAGARVSDAAARSAVALAWRAGEMLAAFQSVDPPGELAGTATAAVRQRYVDDMARRSKRLEGAGIDVGALRAPWRAIESVSLDPLRIQHSDMGPWNILVASDGALSLFDFHNFTLGHPAYDLAYFHEALEGMRRLSLLDGTAIGRAQRALLDGYMASGARPSTDATPALDPATWRAFRIMHVAYFAYPIVTRRRSPQLLMFGARDGRAFVREWIHQLAAG